MNLLKVYKELALHSMSIKRQLGKEYELARKKFYKLPASLQSDIIADLCVLETELFSDTEAELIPRDLMSAGKYQENRDKGIFPHIRHNAYRAMAVASLNCSDDVKQYLYLKVSGIRQINDQTCSVARRAQRIGSEALSMYEEYKELEVKLTATIVHILMSEKWKDVEYVNHLMEMIYNGGKNVNKYEMSRSRFVVAPDRILQAGHSLPYENITEKDVIYTYLRALFASAVNSIEGIEREAKTTLLASVVVGGGNDWDLGVRQDCLGWLSALSAMNEAGGESEI